MKDPHEIVEDALERLDRAHARDSVAPLSSLTRRAALGGGAAGLAATLLTACGSSAQSAGASDKNPVSSIFGVKGGYHFTFVSHQIGSAFFDPTVNGITDACTLLNCSYQWVGSGTSEAKAMASAIYAAVNARVDGIATTLISPELAGPVRAAVDIGIPVISFNADDPSSQRLAYIGQNLVESGREMGRQIQSLLPDGGKIAVFVATPGLSNLAPRLAGLEQQLALSNITMRSLASGASQDQELSTIDAFIAQGLKSYQGYFAIDAGSTAAVGTALQKYNLAGQVKGGGFDLLPDTQQLLSQGAIQFAIDQQPYLQGFMSTLELFLHRATRGLTGVADVDTGVTVVTRRTVKAYATTKSPYEGTDTGVGVQPA